ncbi:glucose-1-phosphate thymidylyltransferase RfbA [Flavobacteriaceae bacterium]|nr:glucose-1-phosphate thymidylyltransferase RfbA [Flavobacteriaceae bacterium]
MKGIILAGGSGTRLYPLTKVISKQLLGVYDKPMINYPLSVLMLAGINEILIISTPYDLPNFQKLFGDGSDLGLKLSYAEQNKPEGLAQAFIIGKDFIGADDVCLILGDNIFYGQGLTELLSSAVINTSRYKKATIFGYYVNDPKSYGVVDFDEKGNALSIEEKPLKPKSNYAVVGLYFYPNSVIKMANKVKPSERGELEITSLNQLYLDQNKLSVEIMYRGFAWLDTGTHESMLEASNFIHTIEKRQGLKVACLEEIAFDKGLINKAMLKEHIKNYGGNAYADYLKRKLK